MNECVLTLYIVVVFVYFFAILLFKLIQGVGLCVKLWKLQVTLLIV